MRLYQYWDNGAPPPEVAEWIQGFRGANPDFRHRLFDRDSASWFIKKHFGKREQEAFELLLVPSMQSDYFRSCALVKSGGVYADADFQCLRPLSGLLGRAPKTFLLVWDHHVASGFLMVRQAQDPYLKACLDFATRNIELRRFADLQPRFLAAGAVAGPDVFSCIYNLAHPAPSDSGPLALKHFEPSVMAAVREEVAVTPELREAVAGATLVHSLTAAKWLGTVQPAYKETGRHWLNWRGSIYADPPATGAKPAGR